MALEAASPGGAAVLETGRARRTYALASGVAGFAFLLALFPLQCHDIWWHLANGREVAEGRGIPRTNLYSFTHPDHPVTPTHWLFGLGAYLVHRAAGPSGLVIAKALAVAAAFLLAYLLARERGASDASAAAVVALAALAARPRFLERPHLFTMLGLAAFALIIHSIRNGKTRRAWVLPALALLWANLHAGCLFGAGLVVLEAAGEGLSWLRARRRTGPGSAEARARLEVARRLALAGGACALVVMISPAGFGVYAYNLWHLGLGSTVSLVEFAPPVPWEKPAFFLMLAGGTVALALDRRRLRPGEVLVFFTFGAFALYAVRGIPNFGLLAAPVIAPRLGRGWRALGRRRRAAGVVKIVERVPRGAFGLALVILPFAAHLLGGPLRGFRIGLGVSRGFFPEKAAEFVSKELPRARAFNDLATGGYLAWRWYPGRRIFVDGRTTAYPPALFRTLYGYRLRAERAISREAPELELLDEAERGPLERARLRDEIEETLGSLVRRYSLDAMLLYFYRGANPFWHGVDLDEWAVVCAERAALVLVERDGPYRDVVRRFEKKLGAEGEAILSRRLALRGSAFAAHAARAADRALTAAGRLENVTFSGRQRASLRMRRGVGLQLAGRDDEARLDFRKVVELEPGWMEAWLNLAFIDLRAQGGEECAGLFEKVRREGTPRQRAYALLGLAEYHHSRARGERALMMYEEFLATGEGRPADRERARRRLREIEAGD